MTDINGGGPSLRTLEETVDRRNSPQFFDEWELVNVPPVPGFPQSRMDF